MKNIITSYSNSKKGFTMVETLIAIAIMSFLTLSAVSLITSMVNTEKRNRTIAEVEWQATMLTNEIAQSARNASAIAAPAVGATSTTLNLTLSGVPTESPTIFASSTRAVTVNKAGTGVYSLTSSKIQVTNLVFQNLTAPGTKGSARVSFTMSFYNPTSRPELTYSTVRNTTITLR